MKKNFLSSLLLCLCVLSVSAQNQPDRKGFTIQGNVENLRDGEMVLLLLSFEPPMKIDTTVAKGGKFSFSGSIEYPFLTTLVVGNPNNPAAKSINVFIENEDITVTGDFRDNSTIQVTGSQLTDKYNEMLRTSKEFANRMEKNPGDVEQLSRENVNYITTTIKENIGNALGLLMLNGFCYGDQISERVRYLASLIPDQIQDHFYAKMIMAKLKNATLPLEVGSKYIPVELPGMDGKLTSSDAILESGKLILIDFWASWCEPCKKKMPQLKKLYEQYHHRGFEIYGISIDTDKKNWIEAVTKLKVPGVHVSSLEGDSCPYYISYGIHREGIPHYILVSKEGVVLYNGDDMDALGKILDAKIK